MSIVTKTGDNGDTGLFGGGRISKADTRMHAIGTVDELNAAIGVVIADVANAGDALSIGDALCEGLTRIQHELFSMGADLASVSTDNPNISHTMTEALDGWIHDMESALPAQQWFILPGGSKIAASLHLARTICRRAERWIVALSAENSLNSEIIRYINRLSDCLFLLARAVNSDLGVDDVRVHYE